MLIKVNKGVEGISFFEHTYIVFSLHRRYSFFLKVKKPVRELIDTFSAYSKYLGLKKNHEKRETAGIGVLKSVKGT